MTTSFTRLDCCEQHDGPHVHGCRRVRVDDVQHPGACITDPKAAESQAAADEARRAAMDTPRRMAWFQVPIEDDSTLHYQRPNVLEVLAANEELKRLDQAGQLPNEIAELVRVILGVIGRLPADGMAEAFPPASGPRRLAVVTSS